MAFDKSQISRMNLDPRLFSVDENEEEDSEQENQENQEGSGIEVEPVDDDFLDGLGEEDPFPDAPSRPENRWENTWVNTNNTWIINNNEWNSNSEERDSNNEGVPREPSDLWGLIPGKSWPSNTIEEGFEDFERCLLFFKLFCDEFGFNGIKSLCTTQGNKHFVAQLLVKIQNNGDLHNELNNELRNSSVDTKFQLIETVHEIERYLGLDPNDMNDPRNLDFNHIGALIFSTI